MLTGGNIRPTVPLSLNQGMKPPPSGVVLEPQFTNTYTDSSREPQYITRREPLAGWLYFESQTAPEGVNRTNCVLGNGGVMAQNFNRLRFLGIEFLWDIPNVNPRNNTFRFYSSNTPGVPYTFILAERYYDLTQSVDVVNAIVAAMNTFTGLSGLTFSQAPKPGFPRTYILSAVGGTFKFDKGCDAILKGEQMYGIKDTDIFEASKQIGTMQMIYTQYVDVISQTATKFSKIPSTTTNNTAPLLVRAYVGADSWGVDFYAPTGLHLDFAWNYSTPLYNLDFTFLDQNGEQLYAPFDGKYLLWNITLAAEV